MKNGQNAKRSRPFDYFISYWTLTYDIMIVVVVKIEKICYLYPHLDVSPSRFTFMTFPAFTLRYKPRMYFGLYYRRLVINPRLRYGDKDALLSTLLLYYDKYALAFVYPHKSLLR